MAVASGFMFCRPEAPQQCLTPATLASAAIVTGGALLWSLTGKDPGHIAGLRFTRQLGPMPSTPPMCLVLVLSESCVPHPAHISVAFVQWT